MNFRQKYSLDAMERVQGFMDTNAATLGTVNTSGARAELDDVVVQLNADSVSQNAAKLGSQGTTSKLGVLSNTLRQTYMRPIARIAKMRLSTVPEFSALVLPDPKIDVQGLISAAEGMAQAAAPYSATFTGLGLATDFITQLENAAAAVKSAVGTRAQYKSTGIGATAGAAAQIRRGRAAIDLLESMVVPLLGNNAQLLAQWRNAKRVVNKPGVVPATPTPPTPPTPANPPATTASPVAASPIAA